jgi:serine/threonine protein kinase
MPARRERAFPPRVVGSWKIDVLLGEGTFTRVYRARPLNCAMDHPADYVLKVLRKQYENDTPAVEMIRRESFVGRRVSHPHLVPILDSGVETLPYHVVMPHLSGVTLHETLLAGDWLPVPHALWIARQVAEALGALHDKGWRHGDIKPSNVFVAADGHTTVVDLGMAGRIDRPGNIVDRPLNGTLNYIAPELVSSTLAADQRSDVYSLGITLYRALTGRFPFAADNIEQLVRAHREMSVPDPRRLRPQLPREVSRFVMQMMAKQPLRRPQNAEEVVTQLTAFEIETFEERFVA